MRRWRTRLTRSERVVIRGWATITIVRGQLVVDAPDDTRIDKTDASNGDNADARRLTDRRQPRQSG